ncbi:MAG: phasin family protein [Beijerinckiaceae bacterium]
MVDPFKTPNFEVPAEMRDLANKSVEQAKRAFDTFMGATHDAATKAQGSTKTMQESASSAAAQAVGFAEQNVKAAFDHAQSLVAAKGLEDLMKLQADFMRNQLEAFQSQMKAMGSTTQNAVKPKK